MKGDKRKERPVLLGVCADIADKNNVDVVFLRLAFCVLATFDGGLIYVLYWLFMMDAGSSK